MPMLSGCPSAAFDAVTDNGKTVYFQLMEANPPGGRHADVAEVDAIWERLTRMRPEDVGTLIAEGWSVLVLTQTKHSFQLAHKQPRVGWESFWAEKAAALSERKV